MAENLLVAEKKFLGPLIVDIGIGEGGDYLEHLPKGSIYIGIDTSVEKLKKLKILYKDVISMRADAHNLPFNDGSIDQLRMYFPSGKLLSGLQDELISIEWFQELSRVLKPGGNLVIWGDNLANIPLLIKMLIENSRKSFNLVYNVALTADQLQSIGTEHSKSVAEGMKQNKDTGYQVQGRQIVLQKPPELNS